VAADVAEEREGVVEEEARGELPARHARAGVDGPREGERAHEVRRDAEQRAPLAARLEDEVEVAVLEVAYAAVDEARGAAGGAGAEVVALDEGDAEAAERGVARDAGARDAPADDEEVEGVAREALEEGGAGGSRVRGGPPRVQYRIVRRLRRHRIHARRVVSLPGAPPAGKIPPAPARRATAAGRA
jgi:hypothetical protein